MSSLCYKLNEKKFIHKKDNTGCETVIMHNPKTSRGDTCHVSRTRAPPQQKAASHSPGTTHQPHVPHNVMFPRLPTARALQKTKAKAKEEGGEFRAKVSRQGLGIEKNNKKKRTKKKTKTGQ